MSQSIARVPLHIVFGTKLRRQMIKGQLQQDVTRYLAATANALDCAALEVNTVDDHVHMLCCLPRTTTMSKLVEQIKKSSSAWIKTRSSELYDFAWQAGYWIAAVGPAEEASTAAYIRGQQEHHARLSFQDEVREFLRRHGMPLDEQYMWD